MTTNLLFASGIVNTKNQHLGKSFKLCLVKYFLFCSLSLLLIQDASSATDMKCEIKSSCSSLVCQYTDPMTVDPGSNITFNCSTSPGGLVQGMTWKQTLERVMNGTELSDFILQESNSTKDSNMPCRCTNIVFTRPLKVDQSSSSPKFINEGRPNGLECLFSGWPLPREVHWYKDGKLITNGTEGIYQSEDKRREGSLRSKLHLPPAREEQEGFYSCSAINGIPGWSSRVSTVIQMIYECPLPKSPTIDSPEVLARAFSNINLTCWIEIGGYCEESLSWHLNNNLAHLESGEKYEIVKKKTHTKCKKQFTVSIFNVTENDEGTYSCHWGCIDEDVSKSAAIDLIVFVLPPTAATESLTTSLAQLKTAWPPNPPSGIRREWLLLMIMLSASVAILLVCFVWFVVKKRWTSSHNAEKRSSIALDDRYWNNQNMS